MPVTTKPTSFGRRVFSHETRLFFIWIIWTKRIVPLFVIFSRREVLILRNLTMRVEHNDHSVGLSDSQKHSFLKEASILRSNDVENKVNIATK